MRHLKSTLLMAIVGFLISSATGYSQEASNRAARAEPIPDATLPPGNAVTAFLTSEDGDNKVVGRGVLDFGEDWSLGLEVASPFDEKTQEEAELLSIDSLGAGSEARIFATWSHIRAKDETRPTLKNACNQINEKLLSRQTSKRKVALTTEQLQRQDCPTGMKEGEWFRTACDFDVLRCVGEDFSKRALAALEQVCAAANAYLVDDLFHTQGLRKELLVNTPYNTPCPASPGELKEELDRRVKSSGKVKPEAIQAGGPWEQGKHLAWVDEQLKKLIDPICTEYTTLDFAPLLTPGGGAVPNECTISEATKLITDLEQSDPEGEWGAFRSSIAELNSFREWFVTLEYKTAKPSFTFLDQGTLTEVTQDERAFQAGVNVSYFTGQTLWTAGGSRIRRFKPSKKQQVCVPTGSNGLEVCSTTSLKGPEEREFDLFEAQGRRFFGAAQRFGGVAKISYSSDDDAFEPHLILYALQHMVSQKPNGLNGGLDFGYNTETSDLIFRVFIGTTFSVGG
ncbi:MAG TPA: hypothetical protein VF789_14765 [Thermoanaerobaculia bacterium]